MTGMKCAALALAIGASLTGRAGAQAVDAAAAFGAREDIRDVSLSPDGKRVAFVRSVGPHATTIEVVTVDGGMPARIAASTNDLETLRGCRWSTADRLVCTIGFITDLAGNRAGFSRTFAIDADGKNLRQLTAAQSAKALSVAQSGGTIIDALPDESGSAVLMTRTIIPENTIGSHLSETRQGVGVERVDTVALKRRVVEPPRRTAVEYITDGHGAVRIMGEQPVTTMGYDAGYMNYSYRKPGSDAWLPLSKVTFTGSGTTGFNPYAIDRELNVAYGFDDAGGRAALYRVSLDGSMKRELVLADPAVDVDGLIRIGRQRRVVGVTLANEKRQTMFFDPQLKALGAALSRALPNLPLVSFVDASADEKRLVLFAGSDTDPGRYYLYDKSTRELNELLPVRPQLAAIKLASVKPVTFPAADGTMIPGYLTLPSGSDGKGLPAIVMPHGGPSARDEWGFDWWAQYFANRGFAVLQPNFRGSSGYGEKWFNDNGFKAWRTAIGDVNDGGRWLVKQGIAAPARLAIVGWSYGGYAALQSAVLDPTLFKAIVAVAPVTDLETLRAESLNYSNHANTDAFIGRGPHVREGSPAQNAERIKAPVLLFHAEADMNVGIGESRLMADRMTAAGGKVELVTFPKLDHQLDDSAVRARMLAKSDAFLRASLGM